MAAGFPPKYIRDYSLDDLSIEQFIVIAVNAIADMDWDLTYVSKSSVVAHTGLFSRNFLIRINIQDGIAQLESLSTMGEIFDLGKNKRNINNLFITLNEQKSLYTTEELAEKYILLQQDNKFDEDGISDEQKPQKKISLLSIFLPTKDFSITPILIDLNILIFILMVISGVNVIVPDTESLLRWGANFRPLTLNGEWWRLITNAFLHIGIFHLLMNMYALLYIGILLEPRLGKARFLSAYLLTGVAASVASLWWHDTTVSAGASGAIFGMYGVFLAMLTSNLIEKATRKPLLTSILFFVGYNLLNGMKGGIDNAAHIGGLVSGIVIGYAFIPSLQKPYEKSLKFITISLLSIVIIVVSLNVYKNISNDLPKYDEKMKQFVSLESLALEVYKLPKNTPTNELLYELNNRGIYYWNENIKLLDSVEQLDIPEILHNRDKKLKKYCQLRIQSYELLTKAISDNTDKYNDDIANCTKQIETIMTELKGEQKN